MVVHLNFTTHQLNHADKTYNNFTLLFCLKMWSTLYSIIKDLNIESILNVSKVLNCFALKVEGELRNNSSSFHIICPGSIRMSCFHAPLFAFCSLPLMLMRHSQNNIYMSSNKKFFPIKWKIKLGISFPSEHLKCVKIKTSKSKIRTKTNNLSNFHFSTLAPFAGGSQKPPTK